MSKSRVRMRKKLKKGIFQCKQTKSNTMILITLEDSTITTTPSSTST